MTAAPTVPVPADLFEKIESYLHGQSLAGSDIAGELRRALAAPPPPVTADREPVAWRWRWDAKGCENAWIPEVREPKAHPSDPYRRIVEPAYSASALSAAHAAGKAEVEAERRGMGADAEFQTAWAVYRQRDPTFPRVFVKIEDAQAVQKMVTAAPFAMVEPLYAAAALNRACATARAEALEEAGQKLDHLAGEAHKAAVHAAENAAKDAENPNGLAFFSAIMARKEAEENALKEAATAIRALISAPLPPREET